MRSSMSAKQTVDKRFFFLDVDLVPVVVVCFYTLLQL